MKTVEARCHYITRSALECAFDQGVPYSMRHIAAKQQCEFCEKLRGIGYIFFTEAGKPRCLYCETVQLFKAPVVKPE